MYKIVIASILAIGGCAVGFGGTETQATSGERTLPSESQTAADTLCAAAIPEFQAALKSNPNDVVTRNKLGICYQHFNRLKEAVKEYKQAVKLNPRYAEAWNNLGSAFHGQKKYKDAVKQYRKAIEVRPEMALAYRNMGTALLAMGSFDEGLEAYRRAFELNPAIFGSPSDVTFTAPGAEAAMHYYYFAKVSAANGKVDAAFEFLKKAQSSGFRDFGRIRRDPDFKAVVSDPRFAGLTK